MNSEYAIVDQNNVVVNVVVWNGDTSEWSPESDQTAILITDSNSYYGGTYDPIKNKLIPPRPSENYIYDENTNTWMLPIVSGDPVKVTP